MIATLSLGGEPPLPAIDAIRDIEGWMFGRRAPSSSVGAAASVKHGVHPGDGEESGVEQGTPRRQRDGSPGKSAPSYDPAELGELAKAMLDPK